MTPSDAPQPEGQRVGDLEIEQDLSYQRRTWLAERIGWSAFVLVLLAAALGLFGSGPFSRGTVADPGGALTAEFGRFCRSQSSEELRIRLGDVAATGGESHIWLERTFLDRCQIESISPEPVRMELAGDRVTYVFAHPDAVGDGDVVFHLRYQRASMHMATVGVADGSSVQFRQLIYP